MKGPSTALVDSVLAVAIALLVDSPAWGVTFTERFISTDAGQPTSVLAADMDGDGDRDVVAAEYTYNLVVWYENNGATPPVWLKHPIDSFASGPITIAVGDVDRDGDLDVFSANFNNEGIAWYRNPGTTGAPWPKQVISAFWVGAWGAHAADVDGDGDIDGVGGLTNTKCGPPIHCVGVEWYDNNGATPPSFTPRPVSQGLVGASSVYAEDLDEDGDVDIVSVDTGNDRVLWFENDGARPPSWTQRVLTTTTDDPWAVYPVDLDRDGDMDVLTASAEDDKVAWHENDGGSPPGWSSHTIASNRDGAISVHSADMDGDGDPDVVAGSWNDSALSWYESDGGASPSFTEHFIAGCGGPEGIFAGRVDNDADADVLCAGNPEFKIHFFDSGANFLETDGDGVRDDLDCAPGDPSAFAVPAEVRNASFPSKTLFSWSSAALGSGPGAVYDTMRGSLAQLPVGSGPAETCLQNDGSSTSLSVPGTPSVGAGGFYLVRGSNACGVGSYGNATSGAERVSAACP
jgi:hypothetical protein